MCGKKENYTDIRKRWNKLEEKKPSADAEQKANRESNAMFSKKQKKEKRGPGRKPNATGKTKVCSSERRGKHGTWWGRAGEFGF